MTDTVTSDAVPVVSDAVPVVKDEGTLDELSKQIEFATDRVAVQRNQQLIDSFIQEKWRETALLS
jgi:sulfur carrier protein ThiS